MTSRTTKMVEGLIRVISAARGNPTQKNKTPIDFTAPKFILLVDRKYQPEQFASKLEKLFNNSN